MDGWMDGCLEVPGTNEFFDVLCVSRVFFGGAGPGGKRRGSSILIEYIIGIHVWFEPGSDNSIMILRTGILHMSTGLGCFAPMIAARGSGRSV